MKTHYQYFTLLLFACLVSVVSCSKQSGGVQQEAPENKQTVSISATQLNRYGIKLDTLHHLQLQPELTVQGKVVVLSHSQAELSSPLAGVVEQIVTKEGAQVSKGQVLITVRSLDFIQLQQDYMAAAAELRFATLEYTRQQALKLERVGAEMELQQSTLRNQAALAKVKALAAKLNTIGINPALLDDAEKATVQPLITIHAPFSGYVTQLPAIIGTRADPNVPLIHIVNLNDLHADLYIFEKDVNNIRVGQAVTTEFTSQSIPPISGEIEYIGRTVSPVERAVVAHVHLTAPTGYIVLPEMAVRARLKTRTSSSPVSTLPASAIVKEDEQAFAYFTTQRPSDTTFTFQRIAIQIGVSDGEHTEVKPLAPLPANARFVTAGALQIKAALEGNKLD